VFTTSETYPWSFVTPIFHSGQPRIESLPTFVLKFYDTCDIVKKTIDGRLE